MRAFKSMASSNKVKMGKTFVKRFQQTTRVGQFHAKLLAFLVQLASLPFHIEIELKEGLKIYRICSNRSRPFIILDSNFPQLLSEQV